MFCLQINILRQPTQTLRRPNRLYRVECAATKRLDTTMASRRAKDARYTSAMIHNNILH